MLWKRCLERLEGVVPAQQFSTWILPLQAQEEPGILRILAPNQFVRDHVRQQFLDQISTTALELGSGSELQIELVVGSNLANVLPTPPIAAASRGNAISSSGLRYTRSNSLNPRLTFNAFVEGKSNQLARAAALQIADNPGTSYNPLFLYGGVGLGKTHLMHAIGNAIIQRKPSAQIAYLSSEQFVADMVKALQHNTIDEFKRFYRSVDALLIDDIQFFAGKDRSQEEFFHTFNTLLEGQRQIVISCDRFPKDVKGVEERLRSRFGWGLTVALEPPDMETRVAILFSKAEQEGLDLPDDVAYLIAKRIRSNVRELEGALRRVTANARFTGREITVDFAREALRDILSFQDKLVTIENIQRMVSDHYGIRINDLLSSRRSRSVARPRQVAMYLSKELTEHSLPEIGASFDRDHTTVMHACRKIIELIGSDIHVEEDVHHLIKKLTT